MATLNPNALKVLKHRYLRRNEKGAFAENPDEMFRRVAKAIACAELHWGRQEDADKWENLFYKIMSELLFLPNSPTLMNAGTPLNQLSACYVLPVEDNMSSIFTTLKYAALIQQSGGGTGFNFSHLRPKDDFVSITSGSASGPVSFMKIFDAATEHIKQGGKRRGANMGILNIDHPDIEEFINVKKTEGTLENFNISVGITHAFMHKVDKNEDWALVHPNNKTITKTIPAVKLWNQVIDNAWSNGDPGVIFLDTINEYNPTPMAGNIESTNPCGEVPLLPFEACNLGSINLSRFIKQDAGSPGLDWNELEKVIIISIHFLDNVIETGNYLIPEIKSVVEGNRKIGLGIMGWAETLIRLEIPYESEQAIDLAHQLMKFIREKSDKVSAELARERGVFKNWKNSIYYPGNPLRNATRLSIAPTGTISIIANTTSSIEPLFAIVYRRSHILDGESLTEMNMQCMDYLEKNNLNSKQVMEKIEKEGTLNNIKGIPEKVKQLFKTALEISPEWHLRHQVAFQQYVDNAVSKTINLPEYATKADVDMIYKTAWQQKAKGITIYRYSSRRKQVLEKNILAETKGCKLCLE